MRKMKLASLDASAKLKEKTLMVVFGSGGHTSEMLMMLDKFNTEKYGRVYFVISMSDGWSQTKITDYMANHFTHKRDLKTNPGNIEIVRIFRSREVKQSYITSVFTTLVALAHSMIIIMKIQPDMVRL